MAEIRPTTVDDALADVYAALGAAVDAEGGVVAFAAAMERPVPDVSRRVARSMHKGEVQRSYLDFLAHLGDAGRAAFIAQLAAAWGYLPPARKRVLTDAERAAVLGSLVTDKAKRAAERENGLPPGSLG